MSIDLCSLTSNIVMYKNTQKRNFHFVVVTSLKNGNLVPQRLILYGRLPFLIIKYKNKNKKDNIIVSRKNKINFANNFVLISKSPPPK